jgi:hypothetical protein
MSVSTLLCVERRGSKDSIPDDWRWYSVSRSLYKYPDALELLCALVAVEILLFCLDDTTNRSRRSALGRIRNVLREVIVYKEDIGNVGGDLFS